LDQIMEDYGVFSKEDLQFCMDRISKRLGPQHAKKAIHHLEIGELREAFSIALIYYDKTYTYHKEIHPLGKKIQISCDSTNNAEIAKYLFNLTNGE
jgi:tRNA 2-selenouridine synthase